MMRRGASLPRALRSRRLNILAPNNALPRRPTRSNSTAPHHYLSLVNSSSPVTSISHLFEKSRTTQQPTSLIPPPGFCVGGNIYARFLSTTAYDDTEDEEVEEWEEEEETDPVIGDGGDGGGIVLRDVSWGERALAVCHQVLSEHFGDDTTLYAFKVSPKGYVYVRLDKLTAKYGCPDIEEIESFTNTYSERLDDIIEKGEIPIDLALEVSSPGAERLLKVPEDLSRFQEMVMRVQYVDLAEDGNANSYEKEKEGIFLLESVDHETQHCVWKLADVKENRAEAGKGRPLSRKQKDWRLHVTFDAIKRVMLYLDSRH